MVILALSSSSCPFCPFPFPSLSPLFVRSSIDKFWRWRVEKRCRFVCLKQRPHAADAGWRALFKYLIIQSSHRPPPHAKPSQADRSNSWRKPNCQPGARQWPQETSAYGRHWRQSAFSPFAMQCLTGVCNCWRYHKACCWLNVCLCWRRTEKCDAEENKR